MGRKLHIRVGDSLYIASERFDFVSISIEAFTAFFFYFACIFWAH